MKTLTLIITIAVFSGSVSSAGYYGILNDYGGLIGVRAVSMGGAFTAVADDASAPFWNPAGLAGIDAQNLALSYTPVYFNTGFNYLSYVYPARETLAFAVSAAGDSTLGDGSRTYFSGSYRFRRPGIGARFPGRFAMGFSYKTAVGKIDDSRRVVRDMGVGILYGPSDNLDFGIMAENLISGISGISYARPFFNLGAALRPYGGRLLLSADLKEIASPGINYSMGAELMIFEHIPVRVGYDRDARFTFGFGLAHPQGRVSVDYGFAYHPSGNSHSIGLTLRGGSFYDSRASILTSDELGVHILSGVRNSTSFSLKVPERRINRWQLSVIDSGGTILRTFSGKSQSPDIIDWDLRDDYGNPLSPGEYFHVLSVDFANGKKWNHRGFFTLVQPGIAVEDEEVIRAIRRSE